MKNKIRIVKRAEVELNSKIEREKIKHIYLPNTNLDRIQNICIGANIVEHDHGRIAKHK